MSSLCQIATQFRFNQHTNSNRNEHYATTLARTLVHPRTNEPVVWVDNSGLLTGGGVTPLDESLYGAITNSQSPNSSNPFATIADNTGSAMLGGIGGRLQRVGVIRDFYDQTGSHCGELSVWWDSATGVFHGYASKLAGLTIIHATSTDGFHWVVNPIPVVGGGAGEHAGYAVRPYIYVEGDTQYLYFCDYTSQPSGSPGGNTLVRVATDWETFTAPVTITNEGSLSNEGVLFVATPSRAWANLRIKQDGATYHMLLEYSDPNNTHTVRVTSAQLLGQWTIQNGGMRLHTHMIDQIVNYSGSSSTGPLFKVGDWWYWFNWLSSTLANEDDHTRLYFCKSQDLDHWTPPRLIRDIEPEDAIDGLTLDQFADLNMQVAEEEVLMWTTVVTDSSSFTYLHKFRGSVAQLGHLPPNDEYPEVSAYPSSITPLTVGDYQDIVFDNIIRETHNSFDGTTFTVPTGGTGQYRITVSGGQLIDGTTASFHIRANISGAQKIYDDGEATTGGQEVLKLDDEVFLAVGDTVKIQVLQGSGTPWKVQGGNISLWKLTIRRVKTK